MTTKFHPKLDETPILDEKGKVDYQSAMGTLTWITSALWMDIGYMVTLISRFQCCPREGHMKYVIKIFGHLKKYPSRAIMIDYRELKHNVQHAKLTIDVGHQYEDVQEEDDPKLPE